MEIIDDSGIDSDQKTPMNGDVQIKQPTNTSIASSASQALANIRRGSDLQKKIQKQRDANRRAYNEPLSKKTANMVSRSRLIVPPSKTSHMPLPTTEQPLVLIASDDSAEEDDEFMFSPYKNSDELTRQLIKDGYNLQVDCEDEDLDLIPPKPITKCTCLEHMCAIQ